MQELLNLLLRCVISYDSIVEYVHLATSPLYAQTTLILGISATRLFFEAERELFARDYGANIEELSKPFLFVNVLQASEMPKVLGVAYFVKIVNILVFELLGLLVVQAQESDNFVMRAIHPVIKAASTWTRCAGSGL